MLKMPRFRPILAAAIPTLLFSGFASAEMIAPGGMTTDDFATTVSQSPQFGGDLEAMQYIPFTLSDDQGKIFYVGQVVHDVLRNPADQTLTFSYEIVNAPSSSVLGVESVVASQFKGYDTNVAILTDQPGDTGPIDALRAADGSNVTFDFDSVSSRIAPTNTSFTFVVKTNATQYDAHGSTKITAFIADSTDEGSQLLAGGDATITTFRPTGTAVAISAPPPVTVSVPLPPAVWGGLPTMVGSLMYIHRLRKRRTA
jgi:hypothetical protein